METKNVVVTSEIIERIGIESAAPIEITEPNATDNVVTSKIIEKIDIENVAPTEI
jgi:hypothetical protein